ncbi:MAG: hypothetical protein ACRDOU_05430 [Streptosporangiaceae bacterium]
MTTATATTTALKPRDRQRLISRLAALRDLDRLMRQPGTLATPPTQTLTQLATPRRTP